MMAMSVGARLMQLRQMRWLMRQLQLGGARMTVENGIRFTPKVAREFEQAYLKARDEGAELFHFQGNAVLVSYAEYLVQYLRLRGLLKQEGES